MFAQFEKDDTMHYHSMRHTFFQLALKCSLRYSNTTQMNSHVYAPAEVESDLKFYEYLTNTPPEGCVCVRGGVGVGGCLCVCVL